MKWAKNILYKAIGSEPADHDAKLVNSLFVGRYALVIVLVVLVALFDTGHEPPLLGTPVKASCSKRHSTV